MLTLDSQIEAVLFFKGEALSKTKLAQILEMDIEEIDEALSRLRLNLEDRALVLINKDDMYSLGTTPEVSGLIESLKKEEVNKDLSRASLETLSIVLYKGPITRAQIDYIRGVNSNFILRNLLIRGLIEKEDNPQDSRSYLYKASLNLLAFLGVSNLESLPEYEKIQKEIEIINQESEIS